MDEEKGESVSDGGNNLVHVASHVLTPVRHGVLRYHHLDVRLVDVVPASGTSSASSARATDVSFLGLGYVSIIER